MTFKAENTMKVCFKRILRWLYSERHHVDVEMKRNAKYLLAFALKKEFSTAEDFICFQFV